MRNSNQELYLHVTAESTFCYDMDLDIPCLYGKGVYTSIAKGRITDIDTTQARELAGVRAVLLAPDIKGTNDFSGFEMDEPCLVDTQVDFMGQCVAIIAARTQEIANQAAQLIRVSYQEQTPLITIDEAIAADSFLYPKPIALTQGDPGGVLHHCHHTIEGVLDSGGQEHWYLETNVALSIPGEQQEMKVYTSTQNPTETQQVVARVLGVSAHQIEVEVRRIGGGFGGKETMANKVASFASLLAQATGQSVYFRFNREEDQFISAKRHPYKSWYRAGFDANGVLQALEMKCYANGGYSRDLSWAVMERSLLHAENSYYIPHIRFEGYACRTNTISQGAFRGFGAPQSMLVIELVMDRIAYQTGVDVLEVRRRNFFGVDPAQANHYSYYGQDCFMNRLHDIEQQIQQSADYINRKQEVAVFNQQNSREKRGLGVTPVKFGISFTNTPLNQAGALINIYIDGTLQLNHGGIEMGQGLNAKIQKIAAKELGVSLDRVKMMPTNTSKVPNTSPTAASTGVDLNGMAAAIAAQTLRGRLARVACSLWQEEGSPSQEQMICFENNQVYDSQHPERSVSFQKLTEIAYWKQTPLSAVGYYSNKSLFCDKSTMKGHPFSYYVYGVAISEVEIDTLTGDSRVIRADIIHDVGHSLDQGIDKGQVQGAYVQALGWATAEDLRWDSRGRLLNISPDTYKIPTISDIPLDFRVALLDDQPNPCAVHQSKALGEPPFIYGVSVWLAIRAAIEAATHRETQINLPAHHEAILLALSK